MRRKRLPETLMNSAADLSVVGGWESMCRFSIISRGDDAHTVIPGIILQAGNWGRKVKLLIKH